MYVQRQTDGKRIHCARCSAALNGAAAGVMSPKETASGLHIVRATPSYDG